MLHHVGVVTLRRLFGADALVKLARAHVEELDGDAVFGLEGLDDVEMERRTECRGVEGDFALFLRFGDDLVPVGLALGRTGAGKADHKSAPYQ